MFGIDDAIGGAIAGGGLASGILGSIGSNRQIQAMKDAINFAKQVDARTYADLAPYRSFGTTQLNALTDYLNTKNPENFIDPGYQFRLNAGTNAIANNAAATGMLQSGDTLRALTEYGQHMGSQEYNNAFNRWLGEGQFRQGLAGMGQNAAVMGGSIGNTAASNVGELTANTNFAAPYQIWGNLAGGMTGMGLNAFASRLRAPMSSTAALQANGAGSDIMAATMQPEFA